jgi:predicted nucleotidyltransferase
MERKDVKLAMKRYFLSNPTAKLRVREIERELGLPLPSVIRYCRELEEEGILSREKTGSVTFYTADRTNERYLLEKKLHNIRRIHESGLIDYLRKELGNPPIILFGSYARGEDVEESDIDIYVESPSKKELDMGNFEKSLERRIQIFRHSSLGEIGNSHMANNIANGITLNSYVEVFR